VQPKPPRRHRRVGDEHGGRFEEVAGVGGPEGLGGGGVSDGRPRTGQDDERRREGGGGRGESHPLRLGGGGGERKGNRWAAIG
jgi:hypothetical protein